MRARATAPQQPVLSGQAQDGDTFGATGQAEHDLVQAAIQGDDGAFAALYRVHVDRVYRYCYYRTGNRADAEDLTQQTFLRAWGSIRRYQPGRSPFIAWLLTISHNATASHYRRPQELPLADIPSTHIEWTDPDAVLSASITRAEVHWAIQRLKPDHQQVILLRFMEDFSVAEVAATMGKTDNHVRVIQHRALAHLRQALKEARQLAEPAPAPRPLLGTLQATVSAAARLIMTPSHRS